jgi:ubiquinone/menaquinone biosynthesis C-methylase UbiE
MQQAAPQIERNEYVDFWNEILVPKFVRFRHILVDGLSHHSAKVFPRLEVRPGDKVVDVGCGFGDTAIELARRVGPEGRVLGIDCCEAFLAFGREAAEAEGVGNVEFVEADVQTYPFRPEFDFCFSRFGTQFFENPVAALRNMRVSLKPGGTMTMIVWRDIADNPWLGLPKKIVAGSSRHRGRTPDPAGRVPSRWPTPGWSRSSWRSPGTRASNSRGSTRRCVWATRPRRRSSSSSPSARRARSIAKRGISPCSAGTRSSAR